MRRHNGEVYRSGAPQGRIRVYWNPDSTSELDPVTAGFERTLGWMVSPPGPPAHDPWRLTRRSLMVIGGLTLIAGLCWVGAFLISASFCPCTIGGL